MQGSKWPGGPGVVGSPCCGHGSPCFLPKANMRERKAKNRLWLCLPVFTSEPALKDKNGPNSHPLHLLLHLAEMQWALACNWAASSDTRTTGGTFLSEIIYAMLANTLPFFFFSPSRSLQTKGVLRNTLYVRI